ncbi:OmpA family protein [Porphyromonas catoniae]|uniref:OmpA family protein n=1 Tax=Porphyromonas catoniae TaxID=41976 RepID=UPI0028D1A60E|nr:OmpA family protein [Porphyromonas catoniae]
MMLKKIFVGALACLCVGQALHAQETTDSVYTVEVKDANKYKVETNLFSSNWFFGLGVGGQMYFGDHDKQMKFLDRITPNFEVYFGKWFTPGIGVRFGANGYEIKGLSGYNRGLNKHYGFVKVPKKHYAWVGEGPGRYELLETSMKYIHAHGDVMFNVTQMICGYNETRFYSLIPYLGVGFATSLEASSVTGRNSHEVTGSIGVINRFRINSAWDINLDIRGAYTGDHFDQEDFSIDASGQYKPSSGRFGEGLLTATLGVSYNFPKRGWDRSTITTIRVNENVLEGLRNRLGEAERMNEDLRKQLEEALNRPVTEATVTTMPLLVTFPINRWTLSNKDRVNLGFLADALKANPKLVYSISGYADKGTGSVKRNIFLARKRAEVVYDCLIKEFGVSESQLTKDSFGGVANMYYNDPRCSRSVLTKVAE